jgi:hypothetical protein
MATHPTKLAKTRIVTIKLSRDEAPGCGGALDVATQPTDETRLSDDETVKMGTQISDVGHESPSAGSRSPAAALTVLHYIFLLLQKHGLIDG